MSIIMVEKKTHSRRLQCIHAGTMNTFFETEESGFTGEKVSVREGWTALRGSKNRV